ncbi:replication initiation protein, partial [Streptococcus infantis]
LASYSIQHNKRFHDTMNSLANNITQLRYIEKTSNSIEYMPLFTRFRVDWKEDLSDMTATVSLSPKFEYILNRLSANFTQYELAEFTNIRSTYAKTAYRLLKQWRTVGRKEFKIDEFKTLLDMPNSYKSSEIDRAVVKPILKQLSPYFEGLKVKKIKSNKRGNPVLGYEFTWNPEMTESYVPNKFDKPKQSKKRKSNVPTWSTPDYVNTTSEEKKVELERKKQEMLARLDNEPPRVLPGQMDMFED